MADVNNSSLVFLNHTFKEELEEAYEDFEDDIVIKHEPKYAEVMQESFFENDYLTSNTRENESLKTLSTIKGSENSSTVIIPLRIKSEKAEDCMLDKITPLNHYLVNNTERLQENVTESLASGIHATQLAPGANSGNNIDTCNKKDQNYLSASNGIDSNTKTINVCNELVLKKNRPNFSCLKCSYVTMSRCVIQSHVKSHLRFKNSFCDGCNFKSTPIALRHHQYKCKSFLLKNPLPQRQENKDNTNASSLSCPKCSYVAKCTSNLGPHIKGHINFKNSSCGGCNFKSTPMALRYHQYECKFSIMKNSTILSGFSCPECSYVTKSKSILEQHIKSHMKSKNSSCNGCNFKSTPRVLRYHQSKCKSFLLKNLLPQLQKNKDDRNISGFSCPKCSYVTKFPSRLEPHIKSHINFKNSSCDGCDFQSTTIAVKYHQYKCESYLLKNPLSQHQEKKNNRNLSRFSCPECSYVTTYKSNFEPHVKSHVNSKNFSCDGCNFKSTPRALRHHQYKCGSYLRKNLLTKRQEDSKFLIK